MLKAFAPGAGSQETGFWSDYFSVESSYEYMARSFATDPLRPMFERYCGGGARVLEGGCGPGHYLTPLREMGARTIGLDFAVDVLAHARRHDPATPLLAGDITALPFRSETLDVYYSGGVMEHFEEGPSPALREAHRVLRHGGMLLVSVPYENTIRRSRADRRPTGGFLTLTVDREQRTSAPDGYSFFQYFYRRDEFRRRLVDHGFEVLGEQPFSLWRGLAELGPLRRLDNLYARRGSTPASRDGVRSHNHTPPRAQPWVKQRLKQLLFAEDRSVPVFGAIVGVGCELAANMRMYICRRN